MPTNREVFEKGTVIHDWACDVNPVTGEQETNAGCEQLIEYGGKQYHIISSWAGEYEEFVIHQPDAEAIPEEENHEREYTA